MTQVSSDPPAPVGSALPPEEEEKVSARGTEALELIKAEIRTTLTEMGHNATEVEPQLNKFAMEIEPDVTETVEKSDFNMLGFVRSRIDTAINRISYGLLWKEKQALVAVASTALRVWMTLKK